MRPISQSQRREVHQVQGLSPCTSHLCAHCAAVHSSQEFQRINRPGPPLAESRKVCWFLTPLVLTYFYWKGQGTQCGLRGRKGGNKHTESLRTKAKEETSPGEAGLGLWRGRECPSGIPGLSSADSSHWPDSACNSGRAARWRSVWITMLALHGFSWACVFNSCNITLKIVHKKITKCSLPEKNLR